MGSTSDGAAFSGFESGLVYLTVEFENVTGQSELQFINVNSQTLSSTPIDRVTPRVAIIGDYGGAVDFGSSITLNPVAYADVLDPFPTISMAVYAPDGTAVTATDNHSAAETLTVYIDVILPTGRIMHLPQGSNSFAASEAGTYTVRITAYDEAGNMAAAEYSVTAREVTNNEG